MSISTVFLSNLLLTEPILKSEISTVGRSESITIERERDPRKLKSSEDKIWISLRRLIKLLFIQGLQGDKHNENKNNNMNRIMIMCLLFWGLLSFI